MGVATILCCTPIIANETQINYDMRLCAAEILSMQGDLNRLVKKPHNNNVSKSLKLRLKSGNQTLGWLCRKESKPRHKKIFKNLKSSIENSKFKEALSNLSILNNDFPFVFDENFSSNKDKIKEAGAIYKLYCASCHDNENLSLPFPIYSLKAMAKEQSKKEFYARMVIGVRGSEKIVFRNPLSDEDIANIRKYLISK